MTSEKLGPIPARLWSSKGKEHTTAFDSKGEGGCFEGIENQPNSRGWKITGRGKRFLLLTKNKINLVENRENLFGAI